MDKEVVEIDRVGLEEALLVHRPEAAGGLLGRTSPARRKRLRGQKIVLGTADHTGQTIDRGVRERQTEPACRPLQHGRCVVRVEDRKVARQPHHPAMAAEQPGGEAVKRSQFHRLRPDERGEAPPHFVGSLVGEGQGDDRLGRNADMHQMGDPVRDDPGFATPGAGEHQQGTLDVGSGPPLGVVE